ncbi:MAG: hypothetical protein JO000_30050 [Alphaproteobacteria bacterium]|nr:hypothetical protein [Alphaproteobacteria bacterium]
MTKRVLGVVALLLGLAFATAARCDDGKLDVLVKFESGIRGLAVATFTTSDGQDRVGALSWRLGPERNAFALRLDQWDAIFDLWKKATRAQGAAWKVIGSVAETGTSDISRITIKSGPGVALSVASAKGGRIDYVLEPADFARFEQAMRDMKASLEAGPAKK